MRRKHKHTAANELGGEGPHPNARSFVSREKGLVDHDMKANQSTREEIIA